MPLLRSATQKIIHREIRYALFNRVIPTILFLDIESKDDEAVEHVALEYERYEINRLYKRFRLN